MKKSLSSKNLEIELSFDLKRQRLLAGTRRIFCQERNVSINTQLDFERWLSHTIPFFYLWFASGLADWCKCRPWKHSGLFPVYEYMMMMHEYDYITYLFVCGSELCLRSKYHRWKKNRARRLYTSVQIPAVAGVWAAGVTPPPRHHYTLYFPADPWIFHLKTT